MNHLKGNKAYCKKCGDLVFVLARDITFGDLIDETLFTEEGQRPKNGDGLKCKKCLTPYSTTLQELNWE